MHILLLNHYAGSPHHGMEFRPYYLAKEWIAAGHKVTIIAANQSHIRKVNPEQQELIVRQNLDGIDYIWIKTRIYSGNGVRRILNMIDYLRGVYRIMPQLIQSKPDVVIASSTYPLDNYPAYKIAKKVGAKYFYEVHDLWPLSPQKLGGYPKLHPFIVVMQIAENFAYKHVDKVVSIAPCAEPHMLEHGLALGKFVHIPNGIYLPEVSSPEPLSKDFETELPKDKKIIGYCGTLGVANALHNLVEVARLVQESHPNLFFPIVGLGPEKDKLQSLIDSYGLKNIKVFPPISKPQVQSFLAICDFLIITWNDSPLYKNGISPNKIFDYMYSARPIVQSVRAGNDILKDARCGITCDTTPEDILVGLEKLLSLSDEERSSMGQNGREYVLRHHTYDVLAKKFLEIM